MFKCIFFNENVWIPIKISLKFVPKGPINNIPAMVQIMAWRRPGDKPLSEPMVVGLPTHIYELTRSVLDCLVVKWTTICCWYYRAGMVEHRLIKFALKQDMNLSIEYPWWPFMGILIRYSVICCSYIPNKYRLNIIVDPASAISKSISSMNYTWTETDDIHSAGVSLTYRAHDKIVDNLQTTFSNTFLSVKLLYDFIHIFTEICF